jgi:hypothetical protein
MLKAGRETLNGLSGGLSKRADDGGVFCTPVAIWAPSKNTKMPDAAASGTNDLAH